MSVEIQFLGAAGTVTGSKYLVSSQGKNILVDAGLFQGLKNLRLKNWDGLPIKASEIDAILLTHAHIDHSGFIPRLIKNGFRGKVFSTFATYDLCKILLPDCGHLLEEEANYLNKHKRSKHSPALPLFTAEEAEAALKHFSPLNFNEDLELFPDVNYRFQYSGHILGAASLVLKIHGTSIAFTGDVGRLEDRMFFPPAPLPPVDFLVTESTYGNRLHEKIDPLVDLERCVNEAVARKGVIVIPAFAVGRAQAIMHGLYLLRKQGRIPTIPMFLNSPMATQFSEIFQKYPDLHRLTKENCDGIDQVISFVKTVEESKSLNERKGPLLIVSASGMLTGGRVLHHLKAFLGGPENTILLSGFQSAGTRGEALQRGVQELKIHGQYFPVKARIENLENMSAHADYAEMIQWFGQAKDLRPKKVFVTHGESSAADEFRRRLTEVFGWECLVPEQNQKIKLTRKEYL